MNLRCGWICPSVFIPFACVCKWLMCGNPWHHRTTQEEEMCPLIHPGCLFLHPAFYIHICPLLESEYYEEQLAHLNAVLFGFSRGVCSVLFYHPSALLYHPLSFRGARYENFPPVAQKALPHINCSLKQAKHRGFWEPAVGPAPPCCKVLRQLILSGGESVRPVPSVSSTVLPSLSCWC